MKHTDALRDTLEIEPRETRESFMLRYAKMQPVAEGLTLGDWMLRIMDASSLAIPKQEHDLLWGNTILQMNEALSHAMYHAQGNPAVADPSKVFDMLVYGLFGHQETLRALRMHGAEEARSIGTLNPDEVARNIMVDMEKAGALYDKQISASHQRE